MYMKNIEKVFQVILTKKKPMSTQDIANILKMNRTLVSRLLNQLVERGNVYKEETRPVQYYIRGIAKARKIDEAKTVFNSMIGFDGSLRIGIEQCKSAVKYPNGGLTLLICGNSGVGKSYLASLVYRYAMEEHILNKEGKFIVFNCADYANNAELLSSKLFGYKKGAFTGADQDFEGIISQANGGYLFLDEVHRLSFEGQEKLFILLDKGVYQQLGDTHYNNVNVRLICATTEEPKVVLIDTFLRRIPIIVYLPDLLHRDIQERLLFIQYFYMRESKTFYKKIRVSKKVINYLLACSLAGNIGELMNIVKVSCASASHKSQSSYVYVEITDLPTHMKVETDVIEYFQEESLEIADMEYHKNLYPLHIGTKATKVLALFETLYELFKKLTKKGGNEEEAMKLIRLSIHRISDLLYFHYDYTHALYTALFSIHVEKGLKLLEKTYGIRYYGNTVKTISCVLLSLHNAFFEQASTKAYFQDMVDLLKSYNYKYGVMAERLIQYLKDTFGYICGNLEILYLNVYLLSMVSNRTNAIHVVIVAHGYSTASSIASVVNQMHSNYIVEAFDMPMDMEPIDIAKEIRDFAKLLQKDKGTIFLVDMGSLFDIYTLVKDCFDGEVVVINNISTQLALAVGNMVNQGKDMMDIIDNVISNSEIKYKYYEQKGKKKVIVTTCATGIGTAYKMRDMIKKCIVQGEQVIEVVSCDYFILKNMGKNSDVFHKYDVQLIITTLGLYVEDVPVMLFSELFFRKNEGKIREVFKRLYDEESVEQMINNLMKMLTLENVISRLIILNPNRVIDNVDAILREIEARLLLRLDSNLKLSLYIHIAIMIERCVLTKYETLEIFDITKITRDGEILKGIFEDCLTDFDVEIPSSELDIVLRLIKEYNLVHINEIGENE